MRTLGRFAVLALLTLSSAALAGVSVRQEVEQGPVGVGDPFRLTVSVSGAEHEASAQLPPGDFQVLGRSRATSVELRSGAAGMETTRTENFIFTLAANRPGRLLIPGARVVADGARFTNEPTTLEVQSGHVARAQEPDDEADPLASILRQMGRPGLGSPLMNRFFGSDPLADPLLGAPPLQVHPGDVRLEALVDRRTAYAGEQVTLSYYLVTRLPVSSLDDLALPPFKGAATRSIEIEKQPAPETTNGVARVLIARRALFANAPGTLQIRRATARVSLPDGQALSISSEPLNLSIEDLPPGPAHAAVGRWSVSLSGPSRARAGEPITIHVSVQGEGDTSILPAPAPSFPAGWKTFPPSTSETPALSASRIGGTRTWDFIVVPSGAGAATIPPVAFPSFDPRSARYETATSQPLALQVEPAAAIQSPPAGRAPLSDAPSPAARAWPSLVQSAGVGLLAILALVVLVASLLWRRRPDRPARRGSVDPAGGLRAARRDLDQARVICSSEHAAAFFETVAKALDKLVAALGDPDAPNEEPNGIATRLRRSGVPAPVCATISQAIEVCRRFAFLNTTDGTLLQRTLTLADEAFSAVGWTS